MENIFQHKNIILTIEKEQSFSKAAQKLFISQPSLSLMVKNLENQIGAPLFDRNYKPPRLTEIGNEYIRIAKEMRDTETAFEDYITSINRMDTGSLRIGANQSLSSILIPRVISVFSKKYPNVHLSLLDANSDKLEHELLSGNIDIVVNCRDINTNLFEAFPICTEQLLLAVPKSFECNNDLSEYQLSYDDIRANRHLNRSIKPAPLNSFKDIPFILMAPGNDQRTRCNQIFKEQFFEPTLLFEMDRLITMHTMVALGSAAAVVSDTVAKDFVPPRADASDIVYYKIDSPLATRTISVSSKKNRYLTKAMRAFIDTLSSLDKI